MRPRGVEAERSTTWLRNTGVGREMLRLIQAKGAPVRRIFRQLAELGVPCSMVEELTGCKLVDWHGATPKHEAKLQALWALAEAYTDVANREPGAVEGLDAVVFEALQMGVWYEAPSCAAVVIEKRADKVRRFVEYDDNPCRPGRSSGAERLWRGILGKPNVKTQRDREIERIIELRLQALSTEEIADDIKRSDTHVRNMLKLEAVRQGIELHRPLEQVEADVVRRAREKQSQTMKAKVADGTFIVPMFRKSPGRPRKDWDDAWLLKQVEQGASVHSLAAKLGTSRQALSYRIRQARRASPRPPPL